MQNDVWFRQLVWIDYRLAVLFLMIVPIILLIWAYTQQVEAIQKLLMIYWRASSLLAVTIYLMIAQYPVSFISGLIGQIIIPVSLWFWVDLNDEIEYQPSGVLKLVFTSWRWAVTIYSIVGTIAFAPFLGCAFSSNVSSNPACAVWFEAPLLFKDYFHHNSKPGFLGFLGIIGLIIYVLYLSYFVVVKLGKQGRSASPQ